MGRGKGKKKMKREGGRREGRKRREGEREKEDRRRGKKGWFSFSVLYKICITLTAQTKIA